MDIVVAGGGVAGLSAALVLAREGHRVILMERDPVDASDEWPAAFAWTRKGIPHFYQPHAFIPRGRKVLREVADDVYELLLAAGATEQDVGRKVPGERQPEDADLVYLLARRPLIEWGLRRAVLEEPRISVHPVTTVVGLVGEEGRVPRVQGVRTSDGERVVADLVVDAMGRRSPMPAWLETLGGQQPEVTASETNVIYYSRYFHILPGNRFPEGPWLLSPRGDLGYGMFATFLGDNDTVGIALGVPPWDRELRALRNETAFMTTCQAIPQLAPLVAPEFSEPITPVLPMGSLQNTLRRYVPDGEPVVRGVIPVGDAFCHTDPTFALGLSMSLVHAVELGRALSEHPEDLIRQAHAYFEATMPEASERFALACDTNEARTRVWRGERLDITRRTGCYPLFILWATGAVAQRDPDVFRRTVRRIGFLDRTAAFDEDIKLQERVEVLFAELLAQGPPPPAGPSRDDLLERLNGIAIEHIS